MHHVAANALRRIGLGKFMHGATRTPGGDRPHSAGVAADDRYDDVLAHCPRIASTGGGRPYLLNTFAGASGAMAAVVCSASVTLTLRPTVPVRRESDVVRGAVAEFEADDVADTKKFSIAFTQDHVWEMGDVQGLDALCAFARDTPAPDAHLGILVSPGQEPWVHGVCISALTLTPPLPPASEWRLTFYGAALNKPFVLARCGRQGPETTLALDNSEVRWSNTPGPDHAAFDHCLAYEIGCRERERRMAERQARQSKKPVRPPKRAAPAVPSAV